MRVMKIVEAMAVPIAPPICWLVLMRPDASPASCGSDAGERGDRDGDEGRGDADADDDVAR